MQLISIPLIIFLKTPVKFTFEHTLGYVSVHSTVVMKSAPKILENPDNYQYSII